jgi:hypothetical protein
MGADTVQKTNVNGTLTVLDGTAVTPLDVIVAFEMGDLQVQGLRPILNEAVPIECKGKRVGLSQGKRTYPTFSFTALIPQISDTAAELLVDMLAGTTGSPFAARVSTLASTKPPTFDLKYAIEGTDFGGEDETLVLEDCDFSYDYSVAEDGNRISVSGTVYGKVTDGTNTLCDQGA